MVNVATGMLAASVLAFALLAFPSRRSAGLPLRESSRRLSLDLGEVDLGTAASTEEDTVQLVRMSNVCGPGARSVHGYNCLISAIVLDMCPVFRSLNKARECLA